MLASANPRAWGARLAGATPGVELAGVPVDGWTAVAPKLKPAAGGPLTAPRPAGVAARSEDVEAPVSAPTVDPPVSAVFGVAPAVVCTWSAVTGWRVRSKPLG